MLLASSSSSSSSSSSLTTAAETSTKHRNIVYYSHEVRRAGTTATERFALQTGFLKCSNHPYYMETRISTPHISSSSHNNYWPSAPTYRVHNALPLVSNNTHRSLS